MQEHLSKDAKKQVVTLLMSHIATPSTLPQPCDEPWLDKGRDLGWTEVVVDLRLKKLEEEEEVVVAMKFWRQN